MNQFPGTNYHDLNLNWLLGQMKTCLAEWETTKGQWTALEADNEEFKEYVTNYLHNLDLTQEISDKIDALVEDGTLLRILTEDEGEGSPLSDTVGAWLAAHITQETGYVIDDTLTVQGAAADAKAAGDAISDLKSTIQQGYLPNSGYLQGYRDSNLNVVNHAGRCTTETTFHLVPGDKLSVENVSSGLQFVFQGVWNGQYVVNSGWITEDSILDITDEGIYFLNIKGSETTLSPEDVTFTVKAIPLTAFAFKSEIDFIENTMKYTLPLYSDSESYGTAGSAYASDMIIPKGSNIVSLDVYCTAAGSLEIGLWNIRTNQYYESKTFGVVIGNNHLNYMVSVNENSKIVFRTASRVRYVNNATGYKITDVSISNNIVTPGTTLVNFGLFVTIYYFKKLDIETNVLKVGFGQEFASINDALTKAYSLESASNPITIIIYPGIYNEVLNINGTHYISIVGINRDNCIIKNGSADYNKAPLRVSGQAYIANLTIIETAENYVSTHGAGTGKSAWKTDTLAGYSIYDWLGTNMAYAVHCDDVTNGEETTCRFENCKIYCECGPAFGSGMQTNQSIELVNCEIESNIDTDVYNYCATTAGKGAIAQGALLCHGKENGENMRLLVKDCLIVANIGRVLYMYPVGTNNDAKAEFVGNAFYSNSLGSASEYYKITFTLELE